MISLLADGSRPTEKIWKEFRLALIAYAATSSGGRSSVSEIIRKKSIRRRDPTAIPKRILMGRDNRDPNN